MKSPFDNEERAAFRDELRSFLTRRVIPFVDQWDEAGEVPWSMHEELGALGVWGFGISEEYGGLGMDDAFMRAAYSELFGQLGSSGVWAALNGRMISIEPIYRFAPPDVKARILPEIISGRRGASLAITEPSGGSDVARLKTQAVREGDDYLISGEKTFITGGMTSDYFVVAARTGGSGLTGISLFLVEAGAEGFTRAPLGRKMGWWASDQATLYFDRCKVHQSQMLGVENRGFLSIMENFNHERVGLIACSVGMMRACLEESITWAQTRETFGKLLIKHQVIRHKIADISARIDACAAYLDQICWNMNRGEIPVTEIANAKHFTTKALEYCASEAMQILGGAGYLRGNRVERIYREVKVMAIGGGSEEIMRDLAVRQMGL